MNVFELFGTIAINNDAANKAITETGSKANKLASSMKTSFDKIGKMAVQCGKVIASGMAVGATAVSSIIKASLDEYAEYEQLVGGVETLFKDSSDKVMQYAKQAYRNQGLSANAYMSQVTSFSAALISGLNGDTAAAAEMANIAISDMADNANTFGTSITDIQNAYQGFAKDNYTMLDNLKLGYGGTAEEMARLINDSGVLGSAMKVTAEDVNDISFDIIIAAIHEVQTQMGITGRTAEESAETISGSWEALKGAWSNLLVGLANDEDMQPLADALIETGNTFANNTAERLPIIKDNFVELFTYLSENGGEILSTLGSALDGLFEIDKTTMLAWETIGGVLAVAAGHPVVGIGLLTHAASYAQEAGEEYGEKLLEKYQFAEDLITGDPEAVEKYNSMSPEDQAKYVTQDEWEEELRQRYEDAGKLYPEGTETTVEPEYTWKDTPSNSIPMPSYEEIIDGLTNGTLQDPIGGFGMPSSNNVFTELQSLIAEMKTVLDPTTLKEAIVAATKEGSAEGLASATITTGNVTLNDGALVGRILPQINLGLGQLTMQRARGNA